MDLAVKFDARSDIFGRCQQSRNFLGHFCILSVSRIPPYAKWPMQILVSSIAGVTPITEFEKCFSISLAGFEERGGSSGGE